MREYIRTLARVSSLDDSRPRDLRGRAHHGVS
jgi:hypothetical protein